jgi:hypothetical protein
VTWNLQSWKGAANNFNSPSGHSAAFSTPCSVLSPSVECAGPRRHTAKQDLTRSRIALTGSRPEALSHLGAVKFKFKLATERGPLARPRNPRCQCPAGESEWTLPIPAKSGGHPDFSIQTGQIGIGKIPDKKKLPPNRGRAARRPPAGQDVERGSEISGPGLY